MHRVLKYHCRIVYEDGSVFEKDYPFTQAQADEVGAVLETDGIAIKSAIRLIEMWNRRGDRGSIKYRYGIPFIANKPASVA